MFYYYYTKSLWLCLFLLLILTTNLQAQGKNPIQNFPPSSYKGGNQNIDFTQNRGMTLFVANNLGVLSYNGKGWDLHSFEFGKKKRSLAFDKSTNRLYVGLQGEFGYLDENWNYVSLTNQIPSGAQDFDEVWDVFCSDSKVYFCTFQNIYVYDGNSIKVVSSEEGLQRSFMINDRLFTQNPAGELLEMQGTLLVKKEIIPNGQEIIAGLCTYGGEFYAIYQSGKIQPATSNYGKNVLAPLSSSLKGTYINHVLQLSDSRLAISTQTSGLFLYDLRSQLIEQISIKDGLLTNACLRSFQDFSGNLWVGMQNGIAMIDINSPMRLIGKEIGIQGSGYAAYETAEGTYYTTSNGIYYKDNSLDQSVFLQGTEGPAYSIRNIAGKIYAGHHRGLFLLKKNGVKHLTKTEGVWEIKQLKAYPRYVIGGTYSGMYLFKLNNQDELEPLHMVEGFNESSRFFEEDKKGRIWVGQYYKGLFKLTLSEDLKSFKTDRISNSQNAQVTEQVLLSRIDNELYFSTKEGVYKLDQNTDQIIIAEIFQKDIGKQPVYLLKQDSKKNIHVIAKNRCGLYMQVSTNNYVFTSSSICQLRYSFNNDLLHASTNTSNGIMINSNEGFINYNPEKENKIAIDNPLIVSKVYDLTQDSILYERSILGKLSTKVDPITISHKAKVIQFFIESFQLKDANNQQFQFFLEGFDKEYGDWTEATMKEYTNLKEGNYSLKVRAKNSHGNLTESEPIQFKVTVPFHRSLFAKVCYFLLLVLVVFWITRYQKNVYKQRTIDLERQKEKQVIENNRRLEDIEKQSKLKLLHLKEEKMQSELTHLNTLLAASTMNLVVKNEFINSIKNKLKEVVSDHIKSAAGKRAILQIEKEIGTTLILQEDWQQFEHHFNQVHGDFLTRIRTEFSDLSPNDQKLCAFLRLNLNTKEISNIMSVSQRGVEIARYRLRKKLNLSKGQNLSKFVLDY